MAVTGNTQGVNANVISRLESISTRLGKDVYVHSGKRDGAPGDSAHNTGIAVDVMISGMMSIAITDELVTAGFSGVGEYYRDEAGTEETNTAHGDIRGLPGSENSGAYAPGKPKSTKTCWHRLVEQYVSGRKSGHSCP
jgi:hypothetical protein